MLTANSLNKTAALGNSAVTVKKAEMYGQFFNADARESGPIDEKSLNYNNNNNNNNNFVLPSCFREDITCVKIYFRQPIFRQLLETTDNVCIEICVRLPATFAGKTLKFCRPKNQLYFLGRKNDFITSSLFFPIIPTGTQMCIVV